MTNTGVANSRKPWRDRMYVVIFEAHTPWGKAFDTALIIAILISVMAVMLESVAELRTEYGQIFLVVEWSFTILFTIEYICRILSVHKPKQYALSFFGIIDLVAILPTYLSFFFIGAQSLLVIRSFRLLRVFRVFKLTHYLMQADILSRALQASRAKIVVFLVGVVATVITVGATMYLIEGAENGFTSIPQSVYWAIVTMTTVGYGDIAPQTVLGKLLASILMILGYGVLAVPTGIVSVEIAKADRSGVQPKPSTKFCQVCNRTGHEADASHCKYCGGQVQYTVETCPS